MTRDVLISISGAQFLGEEQQDVEMITIGDYFMKNGKHYILYDEMMEGEENVIKNTIKVMPDCMDIIKKGPASAHMVFRKDQKNMTCYQTPVGELIVGISTNDIRMLEEEELLKIDVDYSLEINYEHVADCGITVSVMSRENARLQLQQ